MQNLGLTADRIFSADQSQAGSGLDMLLQTVFPPYMVMRNAQAMFDPQYAPGTYFGLGQDAYQGGKGLLNDMMGDSTPQGGVLGGFNVGTPLTSFGDGYYGYQDEGGNWVGVEDAGMGGNSSYQNDYSNVSWDNMTEEEASSWDSF